MAIYEGQPIEPENLRGEQGIKESIKKLRGLALSLPHENDLLTQVSESFSQFLERVVKSCGAFVYDNAD